MIYLITSPIGTGFSEMKQLSPQALTLLTQKTGIDPILVMEIQWNPNNEDPDSNYIRYGDRTIPEDTVDGRIITISGLDDISLVQGRGSKSGNVSVTLGDYDGALKEIINNNDIHKRKVKIYQTFAGLSWSDKILLMTGEISSPIQWSERERTLSFDIISVVEGQEVGFSPEEGYIAGIPEDQLGVPWPIVFGEVIRVPCPPISPISKGILEDSTGVPDRTLYWEIKRLDYKIAVCNAWVYYWSAVALYMKYLELEDAYERAVEIVNNFLKLILDFKKKIQELDTERLKQEEAAQTNITVTNGSLFPQGRPIAIQLQGHSMIGTFTGNTLRINVLDVRDALSDPTAFSDPMDPEWFTPIYPGSQVVLSESVQLDYVVSITPVTIDGVWVYRTVDDIRSLVPLPTDYYSVITETFGALTVTYIRLNTLPSIIDSSYEDEIFVDATSTIGDNTVDILIWLINTFTNAEYDTVSFNATRTLLENYPMNFALRERINIFDLLYEIAWQARCAIWMVDNKFYIKYLSKADTPVATLSDSDIVQGSMILSFTPTEDIVTKFVAKWRYNYLQDEPNQVILRYNVSKYGSQRQEFDFFAYNIQELVIKSATFWLIRYANTWKKLEITCFLPALRFDVWDTITLNFSDTFVANSNVPAVIESMTFNPETLRVELVLWIPVRTGEMVKYDFAFPADISATLVFPTADDERKGVTGSNQVGADIIREDPDEVTVTINKTDRGDRYPSDTGDTKPTLAKAKDNKKASTEVPGRTYAYDVFQLLPEEELTFIDLQETDVIDQRSGKAAKFAQLFRIDEYQNFTIDLDVAKMSKSAGQNPSLYKAKHDSASNTWRADGPFLGEE